VFVQQVWQQSNHQQPVFTLHSYPSGLLVLPTHVFNCTNTNNGEKLINFTTGRWNAVRGDGGSTPTMEAVANKKDCFVYEVAYFSVHTIGLVAIMQAFMF
jgi:hypothetical protein